MSRVLLCIQRSPKFGEGAHCSQILASFHSSRTACARSNLWQAVMICLSCLAIVGEALAPSTPSPAKKSRGRPSSAPRLTSGGPDGRLEHHNARAPEDNESAPPGSGRVTGRPILDPAPCRSCRPNFALARDPSLTHRLLAGPVVTVGLVVLVNAREPIAEWPCGIYLEAASGSSCQECGWFCSGSLFSPLF